MTTKKDVDWLTYNIIGAAICVHRQLGPGLLERVYHEFLKDELVERNFRVSSEKEVVVEYGGRAIDSKLKFDLIVNDLIVVEVKAIDRFQPVHISQLLTYMKLLRKPKGILLNFNCSNIFKSGQKTLVNELYSALPPS